MVIRLIASLSVIAFVASFPPATPFGIDGETVELSSREDEGREIAPAVRVEIVSDFRYSSHSSHPHAKDQELMAFRSTSSHIRGHRRTSLACAASD